MHTRLTQYFAETQGPRITAFLPRLNISPSLDIGLGTVSPFSSAEENMLRRSNPCHEQSSLLVRLRSFSTAFQNCGDAGIRTLERL